MSHQSSRRQKISFIGLFIRPEVNLDWTKLDKNWPDWTRQKDIQLGQIWPSIKNDQNHPKLVFPPKTVNCKIEFLNGPMVDQIDPKWIKIFPKKSPKPFLRPNTWSCSAPFDRNNLKSWLLIYVHLKVTFQFQEISPKFDFFFQILCHQKIISPTRKFKKSTFEISIWQKPNLPIFGIEIYQIFLKFSQFFRRKKILEMFSGSKKNKNR